MVLHYAVPLALFAGTVTTSRAALNQDIPMVIALCAAIIGLYGVVFLFSRFVLRLQVRISALAALTASGPAVPLVAPVVLGDLFGGLSAIPIAISQSRLKPYRCADHDYSSRIGYGRRRLPGKQHRRAGPFRIVPQVKHFGFRGGTRANRERTDRLGTRSRFRYRAERLPHSSAHRPLTFPAGKHIRRRRLVRVRNRTCVQQN
jgi:hypothetical protein